MTDKLQVDRMISYFNDLDPSTGEPVSQKNDLKEDDLTSPAEAAQPCEVDMSHAVFKSWHAAHHAWLLREPSVCIERMVLGHDGLEGYMCVPLEQGH